MDTITDNQQQQDYYNDQANNVEEKVDIDDISGKIFIGNLKSL